MATSLDFMKFVCDQVKSACEDITYKKMFGEYMLYCAGRPVLLICDDTVYVKQIPDASQIFANHGITPDLSTPYSGARPHFILDIENSQLATDMVRTLSHVLPLPKPRKKPTKHDAKN